MKSFRVYLPGGRIPTRAGYFVILTASAGIIVGAFELDRVARIIPGLTVAQAQWLLIGGGIATIALGWLVLRIAGVPFSKGENA